MKEMTNQQWYEKLEKYVAGGSSTGSKRANFLPEEPAVIVRGKGCRVFDADGKEYIDYKNGLGPITLGYANPAIDTAIVEQLKQGVVFGHPSHLEAQAAQLFCELVPCAEKVRFLKTGGEACAAAIKLARAHTKKDHIIQIGYNGWLNTLASGARLNPSDESVGAPVGVPLSISELYHSVGWGNETMIDDLFKAYEGNIAAVIVAAGYPNMHIGKTFYPFLREITQKNDALLIYDEIVTGFRIATGGVQEYFGVVPDLAVFAKGMANGMPLSVFCGRADVMDWVGKGAVISSTNAGETLSLAAAIAAMNIYKNENVCEVLWKTGETLWSGVNRLFDKYQVPIRLQGFWPCPSFVADRGAEKTLISSLLRAAFANGVSLYTTSYVNYAHKEQDVAETLSRMEKAIASLKK